MKRSHKRELAVTTACREHLAGQHRADRVRNSIVHMEQIKIVKFCNLRHAGGESEIVGRVIE